MFLVLTGPLVPQQPMTVEATPIMSHLCLQLSGLLTAPEAPSPSSSRVILRVPLYDLPPGHFLPLAFAVLFLLPGMLTARPRPAHSLYSWLLAILQVSAQTLPPK